MGDIVKRDGESQIAFKDRVFSAVSDFFFY